MAENENPYKKLWAQLKSYVSLNIEYAKLTLAEKATMLLAAIVVYLVALLFGVVILFFLSKVLVNVLTPSLGESWACVITAGVNLLLFVVIYLLRKPLIVDPMARYITKLFFNK